MRTSWQNTHKQQQEKSASFSWAFVCMCVCVLVAQFRRKHASLFLFLFFFCVLFCRRSNVSSRFQTSTKKKKTEKRWLCLWSVSSHTYTHTKKKKEFLLLLTALPVSSSKKKKKEIRDGNSIEQRSHCIASFFFFKQPAMNTGKKKKELFSSP